VDGIEHLFEESGGDNVSNRPVVSMIHEFVADFRKLARDWEHE
jgi:hypothetical protein